MTWQPNPRGLPGLDDFEDYPGEDEYNLIAWYVQTLLPNKGFQIVKVEG